MSESRRYRYLDLSDAAQAALIASARDADLLLVGNGLLIISKHSRDLL